MQDDGIFSWVAQNSSRRAFFTVKRSWAEKNRALLVRYLKAMVQTHRWVYRFSRQGNSFEARSGAQGMGVLHDQPHLASQRGDRFGGTKVYDANLCRAE